MSAAPKIRRVGHLYPSGGINDLEPQRMAPAGLEFLTTRMPFRDTSHASDLAIADDLERNARLLADAQVELIAFNCTAASLFLGPEFLRQRIHAATGLPSVMTIEAVMEALAALKARRIALLTPYPPEVFEPERVYLAGQGIEVMSEAHHACLSPVEQGEVPPKRWLELIEALDLSGVDAVLMSCAGIRIAEHIAEIENRCGRPVVTSNSALIRSVCKRLGHAAPEARFGALMRV